MEQLIQVQILAQTIIEFSNAMTAGLEAVLGNKLGPSLVPENLLQQDFTAFAEHAATEGLTVFKRNINIIVIYIGLNVTRLYVSIT